MIKYLCSFSAGQLTWSRWRRPVPGTQKGPSSWIQEALLSRGCAGLSEVPLQWPGVIMSSPDVRSDRALGRTYCMMDRSSVDTGLKTTSTLISSAVQSDEDQCRLLGRDVCLSFDPGSTWYQHWKKMGHFFKHEGVDCIQLSGSLPASHFM